MLNIYIWTHCDKVNCKQTMCVSRIDGKSDRANTTEMQAIYNNRKKWFFPILKIYCMWTSIWRTKNYAKCELLVYVSTDETADAAFCSILAALILTPEETKPLILMHIKHCLIRAKAIPIQEVQKLLCVDAAASYAESLCMWCLASLVDIFWEILLQNLWNNSERLKQFTKQRSINKQTVENNSLFISSKSVTILECWSRVIIIGNQTDNFKAENYSAIHYRRMWYVFELWFPSCIVSAHTYVAMTSWQIERVINKKLHKFVEEFNSWYW